MTLTSPGETLRLDGLRGPSGDDLLRIGAYQNEQMLRLLKTLEPEEWNAPTDCDRWTVKDIVGHLIGWAECFASFKEFRHQFAASIKRRKELGNPVNAQNEQQVEDRRHLTPDEIIERFETSMQKFLGFRMTVGKFAHYLPYYDPSIIKYSNVGYIARVIFTRDMFMHRVDIARATDRPVSLEREDAMLLRDVVSDWSRRHDIDATIDLGPIGTFVAGQGGRARISGDGPTFARVMTGRAAPDELKIEGDVDRATEWLTAGVPF
jgi:uncharacterized protein (TIGR03083 family)